MKINDEINTLDEIYIREKKINSRLNCFKKLEHIELYNFKTLKLLKFKVFKSN